MAYLIGMQVWVDVILWAQKLEAQVQPMSLPLDLHTAAKLEPRSEQPHHTRLFEIRRIIVHSLSCQICRALIAA